MMDKALGALIATAMVLAALASWPTGRAGDFAADRGCDASSPAPDPSTAFENLAASHVLDRDGLASNHRLVEAAQAYANANRNCTVDASSADWTTSLWREPGRGWRVAFRTISAILPDDPRIYLIGVDLDDDGKPIAANVVFR